MVQINNYTLAFGTRVTLGKLGMWELNYWT